MYEYTNEFEFWFCKLTIFFLDLFILSIILVFNWLSVKTYAFFYYFYVEQIVKFHYYEKNFILFFNVGNYRDEWTDVC